MVEKKNFALSFVFINYPFKTVYLVKIKKKKKIAENPVNNCKIQLNCIIKPINNSKNKLKM